MQIASSARCTGRLCASASLYTRTDWMPSSRHARITRRAISPRLAMMYLSKDMERLLQCLRVGHVRRPRIGENSLRQPGQDVSRTELDESGRALPLRAPHRGDPLYRRPHLSLQQFGEIGRLFVLFRIDVRDDRVTERVPARLAERHPEVGRDRAHRRRVERARGAERDDTLGIRLSQLSCYSIEIDLWSADNDLAGRVVIRDDEAGGGDGTRDGISIEPEHRGHRATVVRALHELAATAHQADGVSERERTRGDERGELAERVTEQHEWLGHSAGLLRRPQRGDRSGE